MSILKRVLKEAIDEKIPKILGLKAEISALNTEKGEMQNRLNQLKVELELKEEKLDMPYSDLVDLMEENEVRKLTTNLYAIERCRDANPTVEVTDIALLPKRYIVEKPKADKRLIQTEFVNSNIVPPGVKIQYGQYLKIIEREAQNG